MTGIIEHVFMGNGSCHYDQIPDYCLQDANSILDVGSMNGLSALLSRHREHFLNAEARNMYQGVDIQQYPRLFLEPILTCDILDFETGKKYDLVLALHVVEHIAFENWPRLFDILHGLVAPGGYLVVATPHKENEKEAPPVHVVFDIRKELLSSFMPHATICKPRVSYRHFREWGESRLWATARFVWRLLKRHKLRFKWVHEIIAIEKRELDE